MKRITKVYVDYNILGRLIEIFSDDIPYSKIPDWKSDNESLPKIWNLLHKEKIKLVTCENDCYMEFKKWYPNITKDYKCFDNLPDGLKDKLRLYNELDKGKLHIFGYGTSGYGVTPYGGSSKENFELLNKIKDMLNIKHPKDKRDATHLMHCVLYGCDYFLTMDYRTIIYKYRSNYNLIEPYLLKNNYKLKIVSPSELWNELSKLHSIE